MSDPIQEFAAKEKARKPVKPTPSEAAKIKKREQSPFQIRLGGERNEPPESLCPPAFRTGLTLANCDWCATISISSDVHKDVIREERRRKLRA
jgi:hypothetical protein